MKLFPPGSRAYRRAGHYRFNKHQAKINAFGFNRHNKFPKILKLCDLVTEMKMVKHPYYKGILAQKGIDY